jgi:subtilisin family serine protease
VPGGHHVRQSGTSMSAPQVTNLAAKLIALDPALTPQQTIALIRAGATPSAGGRIHNINPKRSVELLRKQKSRPDAERLR